MRATDVLVLPGDVALTAADTLAPELRRRLESEPGDWVLGRSLRRERSVLLADDGAAFLGQFRSPKTVVAAILAHCAERSTAPLEVLEQVVPLVRHTRRLGFLVEHGSPAVREVSARLAPGTRIAGVRIERCVHLLDDVEVYAATTRTGASCAVKLAHRDGAAGIAHEVRYLRRLSGRVGPRLIDHGTSRGLPFHVTEWCGNRTVAEVAAELRQSSGSVTPAVLELCLALSRAYANLHEAGVLHGDVNAKNALVRDDGSVALIDFAASCRVKPGAAPVLRAVVAEYAEPELARALAAKRAPPRPSAAGEQYALAALCYFLICGDHYCDFALVRSKWLAQVARRPPRPFRACGLAGGIAVERVLRKALSKRAVDRFASVRAFTAALAAAAGRMPVARLVSPGARAFLAGVTDRFALRDGRVDPGECEAPRCSINYGASGIAYLFYRLATLRGDPKLLAGADAWACWARANAHAPDASLCAARGINADTVGRNSLYHHLPGLEFTQALISHAQGDWAACNAALGAFAVAAARPNERVDVATGVAGLLLGCAALLEALPVHEHLDRAAIESVGRTLAARLGGALGSERIAARRALPWLGVAHGWAGALFAALRWQQATGAELAGVRRHLSELATRAVWSGPAAAWPLGTEATQHAQWLGAGWCHGSAGYVQLWALADRVLPGNGFARYALGAAAQIWQSHNAGAPANGSLCCGYAGQGFAMLTLYRGDGRREWLRKSSTLLDRAIARAADAESRPSLYKGDAGIALLAEELSRPAWSAMPVFESEGWPRRS